MMGARENAIAKIRGCRLDLVAAKQYLEPVATITGYRDPGAAYEAIGSAINRSDSALAALQVAGIPVLERAPAAFAFTEPTSSSTLGVRNGGTGVLQGSIVVRQVGGGGSPPPWLSVQPTTFESRSRDDESLHTVSINYSLIAPGATVYGELYLSSNGGTATTSVQATRSGGQATPILDVSTTSLLVIYPTASTSFDIFNAGDTTKSIAWTVAEEEATPMPWVSEAPISGTVTSERDTVVVTPDWGQFTGNPGQTVTKSGDLIVAGTYQGNPVGGSPKTVGLTARRTFGDGGIEPCSDIHFDKPGTGDWLGWCTDGAANFPSNPRRMIRNAIARRTKGLYNKLPNGLAPPFWDSDTCFMACDIKFDPDWLVARPQGGMHLFMFGACPYRMDDGRESPEGIRIDYNAVDGAGGAGFGYGLSVSVYHTRAGVFNVTNAGNSVTQLYNYFTTDWRYLELRASYNRGTGLVSGYIKYGTTTKNWQVTVPSGIGNRLGAAVGWGNVDSRSGYVYLRNEVMTP